MVNSDKKLKCGTALERAMNKKSANEVCDGAKKRLMDSIVAEIEDKGYTNSEVCSMTCVPSSRVKDLKEKRGDGFQFETLFTHGNNVKIGC